MPNYEFCQKKIVCFYKTARLERACKNMEE